MTIVPVATPPLLAGALRGFALADVLQLLELGARSGVLTVDGGPLGRGTIALRGGRIVHATLRRGLEREADTVGASVAALLDVPAGRWAFHVAEGDDASSAHRGAEGVPVGAVLLEAARRRDERAGPTPRRADADYDVPTLHTANDAGSGGGCEAAGCLTAGHLRVLAAVDGVRDLAAIAAVTCRDVAWVRESVTLLRALELVSPRPTSHAFAPAP